MEGGERGGERGGGRERLWWEEGGKGNWGDCFLRMMIPDAKHKRCAMSVLRTKPELSLRFYLPSSLGKLHKLTCEICP